MKQPTGVWVGGVIAVILIALGLWWVASNQPLDTSTTGFWNRNSAEDTTSEDTDDTTPAPATINSVDRSSTDVASIVAGLSGTSQFNALFSSTGVKATINARSESKYTIFVPTNGAFAQLAAGTVSNMSAEEKKRLVQYHVISGQAIEVDSTLAGQRQALSGDTLNFSFGPNNIPMVNSAIVITEYTGSNGTVYLIDNVLLPPQRQTI